MLRPETPLRNRFPIPDRPLYDRSNEIDGVRRGGQRRAEPSVCAERSRQGGPQSGHGLLRELGRRAVARHRARRDGRDEGPEGRPGASGDDARRDHHLGMGFSAIPRPSCRRRTRIWSRARRRAPVQDPLTGVTLAPPSAPNGADSINGHEYSSDDAAGLVDDLQYATVFVLPAARDCSYPAAASCDCSYAMNDQPICEPNPSEGGYRTLQTRGRTYPGIRPLAVVKSLGAQGIVGSASPPQLRNPTASDYGYRPNVSAVMERVRSILSRQ